MPYTYRKSPGQTARSGPRMSGSGTVRGRLVTGPPDPAPSHVPPPAQRRWTPRPHSRLRHPSHLIRSRSTCAASWTFSPTISTPVPRSICANCCRTPWTRSPPGVPSSRTPLPWCGCSPRTAPCVWRTPGSGSRRRTCTASWRPSAAVPSGPTAWSRPVPTSWASSASVCSPASWSPSASGWSAAARVRPTRRPWSGRRPTTARTGSVRCRPRPVPSRAPPCTWRPVRAPPTGWPGSGCCHWPGTSVRCCRTTSGWATRR